MMNDILRADIDNVLSDSNIPWSELQNATVLVTGAAGLVGSSLIRLLAAANEQFDLNICIIGHNRNEEKGAALSEAYGIEVVSGDIRSTSLLEFTADRIDYIFHCASITKSAEMIAKPYDVMTIACNGTQNMLDLARVKGCKGFVYLSSMEVYTGLDGEVVESDSGILDTADPRSCYPASKRLSEMLCFTSYQQYGLPVRIARLAQTFGAGIPKDDTRVFAQFARSAINGKNIELHTEGNSRGNYCYISDTIRGLLTILLRGKNGETYNIANPAASVTIREMAELVANDICGGKIMVTVNAPEDAAKRGYAPDAGYRLNADKLISLGWKPQNGLASMYRRMIEDWAESEEIQSYPLEEGRE